MYAIWPRVLHFGSKHERAEFFCYSSAQVWANLRRKMLKTQNMNISRSSNPHASFYSSNIFLTTWAATPPHFSEDRRVLICSKHLKQTPLDEAKSSDLALWWAEMDSKSCGSGHCKSGVEQGGSHSKVGWQGAMEALHLPHCSLSHHQASQNPPCSSVLCTAGLTVMCRVMWLFLTLRSSVLSWMHDIIFHMKQTCFWMSVVCQVMK